MPPKNTRRMLTFGFVGADRRVGGHEQHVFAQLQQRRGERVVVQTTAAVHARRAGRDVGDLHGPRVRVESGRQSRQADRLQLTPWTPCSFMSASHGSRSSKMLPGFGIENAADEDVGQVALMLRILADELADAELAGVKREHQLADPIRADGESGHPFAELRGREVVLLQSLR